MFRVLLVLALVAASLPAQRPARRKTPAKAAAKSSTPADRWPLAEVRISGNKIFPTDAIVRETGLKLGALVNKDDFQRAVERLTATGAFQTIGYHYDPVGEKLAVTFEVQEVADIYPVGFERLEVPDAELMKSLSERVPLFGPQVPATGEMVKRITAALEAYLKEKNKPASVAGRLLAAPGGKLVMTFRPTAPAPVVTYVRFEGSRLIPPQELQKAFYQVAVATPYTEARFRELLDSNIRPMFEALGRLEVRFGPLRTDESKEATGVEVTVPVQDGDAFQFGRVSFAGNTKVSSIELSRLVKLEEGALANFNLVNKAVADVERRYGRDGYMHAKATVERKVDDKKKTVDLLLRVSEGDRYTMRTLTIQGLDLNGEDAVRRRWAIQRGQSFDGLYPETFLKRIESDGMFDNLGKTNFRLNVDEPNKAVDVVLEFKGAPVQKRRSSDLP